MFQMNNKPESHANTKQGNKLDPGRRHRTMPRARAELPRHHPPSIPTPHSTRTAGNRRIMQKKLSRKSELGLRLFLLALDERFLSCK